MSNSPNNDSALALRINAHTHLSHTINPSSQVGPEPMEIPVTGYSMVAEMTCLGKIDIRILGFRAEVIQQISFQSDGIMIALPPNLNMTSLLPPDEEELVRKAMEEFIPLEIPHFEILLDKHPPIIRPALKADGRPARPTPQLPFTLHPGEYRSFFLAPVTHSPDLTAWSLHAIWEFEGKRQESPYGTFQVTGDTGWTTFIPYGEPSPTPVNKAAYDHWDIQYNSTPQPSKYLFESLIHSGRILVRKLAQYIMQKFQT